ncbi:hypothetical protein J2Z66_005419 [Paenibacillus eucommiae]|uniref:Uncharacterized protein n=1 Tax=Paenibacillus eucommiae TaxID=1355755 RepID=A0ABS4J1Y6_9BACL|nr:hypothetical protein [Paenibacillus eucommiae]
MNTPIKGSHNKMFFLIISEDYLYKKNVRGYNG